MFSADVCSERTRVPLTSEPCYDVAAPSLKPFPAAPCVEIGFRIEAFQLRVVKEHKPAARATRTLVGVANNWPLTKSGNPAAGVWTADPTSSLIDWKYSAFEGARGAYVVKLRADEAAFAAEDYVTFTVSLPSTVYIFRHAADVAAYRPAWLQRYNLVPGLFMRMLRNTATLYQGYSMRVAANRNVSVPSAGFGMGLRSATTQHAVLVQFIEDESPPLVNTGNKLDRAAVWGLFMQWLVMAAPFLALSYRFIKEQLAFRCAVLCSA
jgi:hypothetical protein